MFSNAIKVTSIALMLGTLSACAPPNNFIGKWSGSGTFSYAGTKSSVGMTCNFTQAFVQCKEDDSLSNGIGSAYAIKSPTEAVGTNAALDFNLQPDGSMIFSNGTLTLTLHRVAQ